MVLHNSKWDKKATKAYNRKHGIVRGARPDPAELESIQKAGVPGSTASERSNDLDFRVEDLAEAKTSGEETSHEEDSDEDEGERKPRLPSNAWRYAQQEADEEFFGQDEEPMETIYRPADGGFSKYLQDDDELRNLDELKGIFVSEVDNPEKTDRIIKKKNTITYSANDEKFAEQDRRLEKLKFTESVRDKYLNANRRQREENLERLKRLPPSVALSARERAAALDKAGRAIDDETDQFWKEMEDVKSEVIGVPASIKDAKGSIESTASVNGKLSKIRSENSRQLGVKENVFDPDDQFLDDLLARK
ncbi:hypothetical protein V1512DRAFT_263182 [Lipomyces arxii]|uniref:uncharacterized protein n=1 Tax=Lipomyces arxii TaxID=56418 RepID=UPI0034CF94B8